MYSEARGLVSSTLERIRNVNIFVDESGSFVSAPKRESWNCVVAYMTPEIDRRLVRDILTRLKRDVGVSSSDEIKLKNVPEDKYFEFLGKLIGLNGIMHAVATDAGINDHNAVVHHQKEQVKKITKHKPVMKYPEGKQAVQSLADQVSGLSPQLYVQMICQVLLLAEVVLGGVLYFVQRFPRSLGSFRWRIDQKNSTKTEFEDAFEKIAPPLLQTISLTDSLPMLEGADYSSFSRFDFPKGEEPTYLKDTYGIDVEPGGLNIGKLIRENIRFEDSKSNQGVQIADLLASGLRRCLRQGFKRNDRAAELLGKLMVQNMRNRDSRLLVIFEHSDSSVSDPVSKTVQIMDRNRREMLTR